MAVNKVEAFGETLIDLTSDTVTPETLAEGATAHTASGEQITGRAVFSGGGEDEVVWVNCFLNLATMQVEYIDSTYDELLAVIGKKVVKIAVDYAYGVCVGDLNVYAGANNLLVFQVIIRSNLGGLQGLFYFCLSLDRDNEVTVDPYILDTTSLGGS